MFGHDLATRVASVSHVASVLIPAEVGYRRPSRSSRWHRQAATPKNVSNMRGTARLCGRGDTSDGGASSVRTSGCATFPGYGMGEGAAAFLAGGESSQVPGMTHGTPPRKALTTGQFPRPTRPTRPASAHMAVSRETEHNGCWAALPRGPACAGIRRACHARVRTPETATFTQSASRVPVPSALEPPVMLLHHVDVRDVDAPSPRTDLASLVEAGQTTQPADPRSHDSHSFPAILGWPTRRILHGTPSRAPRPRQRPRRSLTRAPYDEAPSTAQPRCPPRPSSACFT